MPMVDLDWLRDHVEVPQDTDYEQLARDLVKVGLEEEEIHASQVTGPIVVGYVVDATPEPQKNGKIINWCHVDVGEQYNATDEDGNKVPRGIICGAPNMRAGEKVVVTLPGAVLPGDFRIEPRKTYGHISDGMCASERELGLGDSHEGIILLREYGFTAEQYEALQPGDDAMRLLHLDQPILEINITPDRGYALSYRGVAREYHHSTGAVFTDPAVALSEAAPQVDDIAHTDIEVAVEDTNPIHGVVGADRYYARLVRGINPSAKTPHWMRRRLIRAGVRPISLAVDITNYVMLDLGQPMHAYDADLVEAPIVVRRAYEGETLVTLDGKERKLSTEDLVISDSPNGNRASRAIGLAGVMGGQYGEVSADTRNILLEAAHFDAVSIARSSRRHKLSSEASRRFERGVDTQLQPAAAQMAASLLEQYAGGQASQTPTDYNQVPAVFPINFKASEVSRIAGLDVDVAEIERILTDIGCGIAGGGNGEFSVAAPSWRPDLQAPCDLVEEVARLVGYDQIPVRVPAVPTEGRIGLTFEQRNRRYIADELAQAGMVEALTYPFVGEEDFKGFGIALDDVVPTSVEIANPLAGDRPYLRQSVMVTLMQTVRLNRRRGMENVSLYELGHVYIQDPNAPEIPSLPGGVKPSEEQLQALDAGLPDQPMHVAGIFTGLAVHTGWMKEERGADWSDAVAAVSRIADRIGAHLSLQQPESSDVPMPWHPGRFAYVYAGAKRVGMVGEFHPQVCENLDIPRHSAAFELNVDDLVASLDRKPIQARPVSTFPLVRQDLAFEVDDAVPAAVLQEAIEKAAGDLLESVELFDMFTGAQVGAGKKSLAFEVTFRAQDRTLSSEDMETIRAAIIERADKLGATLRA